MVQGRIHPTNVTPRGSKLQPAAARAPSTALPAANLPAQDREEEAARKKEEEAVRKKKEVEAAKKDEEKARRKKEEEAAEQKKEEESACETPQTPEAIGGSKNAPAAPRSESVSAESAPAGDAGKYLAGRPHKEETVSQISWSLRVGLIKVRCFLL